MADLVFHPVVVASLGWIAGWWLWGRPRRVRVADAAAALGSGAFTVIVPARDEATVIPLLLADLAADVDPGRRVIVVDDHSTDGTGDVARAHAGVLVVDAPVLPPGWTGKSWACHVGVQVVADDDPDQVVVFLDADVRLDPGALRAVVDELGRRGGIVSVQPFHTTEHPYEQCSLFCGIVGLMGTGAGRTRRRPDGVFGPVLATSLADYRSVGGHAAIRAEVTEDVALGMRYRDTGLPVAVRLGGPGVRFRMYPRGPAQLIEGWTKNMAAGAGAIPLTRSLLTALWITAAGTAFLCLPLVPGNDQVSTPVGVALYLAYVAQIRLLGRATGTFGLLTSVVYPLPLMAFVALFLRSTWRLRVRGTVRWRGRTIPVGGTRAS